MKERVENQNIIEIGHLASPRESKTKLPLPKATEALVLNARHEIRDILHGRDSQRLVVITGPCSIHDPDAAYEFAYKLKKVADSIRDRVMIVMRTYFESQDKPIYLIGERINFKDEKSCVE